MTEPKNDAPALVDGLTYPGGHVVSYGYGSTGSIDDRLHRAACRPANVISRKPQTHSQPPKAAVPPSIL